jgi:CRISPR/Cas system-associated endonuclease Cas3-HD
MRDRVVPEYVIKRMYKNFYIPYYYEGWDDIHVLRNGDYYNTKTLTNLFYDEEVGLCNIDHENPHHRLSIGDHSIACYLNVLNEMLTEPFDKSLSIAALLHDIGKPFTKEFKNGKGEPTETAHYYQHHLVSAYNAIEFMKGFSCEDVLEISAIIQWHMFPYFWEKENNNKMKNKYQKLWGEALFNKIMALHKADKEAH